MKFKNLIKFCSEFCLYDKNIISENSDGIPKEYLNNLELFLGLFKGKAIKPKIITYNVYDVIYTNGNNLAQIFDKFKKLFGGQIQLEKWLNSRYVPTPTIIEATEVLYNNHSVDDISQNEAAENLTKTSTAVQKIIEYSKQNPQKSICFISRT